MQLKADEVLTLCRQIHHALSCMDVDEGRDEWRIFWISGLCMLRSVGQVLDKVDGKSDPYLATIIADHWLDLKANREANWIFWEFIDRERDNILKEFELGAAPEPLMLVTEDDLAAGVSPDLSELLSAQGWELFTSDGLTAIDAFEEGILFWSEYLKSIKAEFEKSSPARQREH